MPNSRDFQADSIQIGNLIRALRESANGDLVFRDEFFPDGVRLRDFLSQQSVETLISAISGNLQDQIDNLDLNYVTDTELNAISGAIQVLINNNTTNITTISGDLTSLQTQFNNLDLTYATDASVASISSNLQSQITSNDNDIDNLQAQINAISGSSSDFLGLTDTPSSYSGFDGYLVAISGNNLFFKDPATITTDTSAIESQIQTISADLNTLETHSLGITGGIIQLDERYVNTSGDIMSGDLTIQTLSGSNDRQLKVDSSGKLQQTGYAPIIGGKIQLNTIDDVYSVTDSNITTTTNPVCTLIAPISSVTIYAHNVVNIQNGSFEVVLSDVPAISGYYLNWMSLQYT